MSENTPSQDAAATAPETAPASAAPELDLAAQLAELQAKNAELADLYLRAQADVQNARRRADEEVSKARKFAVEGFADSLLPVLDSLQAGLAIPNATIEHIREGSEATLRQLKSALAAVSGLIALGGFIMRQWVKYQRQSLKYQKELTDNVYYRNVNNNAGIFDTLIGEAEEQECKEAFLAYHFLLAAPRSQDALDAAIGVDGGHVAGGEPAVRIQCLSGRLGVAVVALHHSGASDQDLAVGAGDRRDIALRNRRPAVGDADIVDQHVQLAGREPEREAAAVAVHEAAVARMTPLAVAAGIAAEGLRAGEGGGVARARHGGGSGAGSRAHRVVP